MTTDHVVFHFQGQPIRFSRSQGRATPLVPNVHTHGLEVQEEEDGYYHYRDHDIVKRSRPRKRPGKYIPEE